MLEFLNAATLAFVLLAMFLAFGGTTIGKNDLTFGGDQWSEKDAPLYARITLRGWFALVCLLAAVALGFHKEERVRNIVSGANVIQAEAQEATGALKSRISKQIAEIASMQSQISSLSKDRSSIDSQIETHHLSALEAAFRLSAPSGSRQDEATLSLDGRALIPLPSQYRSQMRLAGGDQFHFITFVEGLSERDLVSIQLKVGDKNYPLFKGKEKGFFERTLRLPGNPEHSELAVIENPLLLNDMKFKIFVSPKAKSMDEHPFKTLLLESPFSSFARERYKVTTADMLNMRVDAKAKSRLLLRLPRGSFVRVLQKQSDWLEIQTPGDRKGWVKAKFVRDVASK